MQNEAARTVDLGDYYAIQPIQPELQAESVSGPRLEKEYSSADSLMTPDEIRTLLERHSLMPEQGAREEGEFLR